MGNLFRRCHQKHGEKIICRCMVINIIMQTAFTATYSYYWWANPDCAIERPQCCVAKGDHTHGILCPADWETDKNIQNVSLRYYKWFEVMFWLTAVSLLTSFSFVFATCFKPFERMGFCMSTGVNIAGFVMLIWGSTVRFSTAGRACAVNGHTEASFIKSFMKDF